MIIPPYRYKDLSYNWKVSHCLLNGWDPNDPHLWSMARDAFNQQWSYLRRQLTESQKGTGGN